MRTCWSSDESLIPNSTFSRKFFSVLWGLKSPAVLKTRYIISPSPAACIFKPLPPDRVSARLQFHTSVSATSERPLSWTSDKRARKRRDRTVLTRLLKELSQGSISGRTEWPHHRCESSQSLRRAWRGCTWTSCPKHEKSKQTNYPSGGQWWIIHKPSSRWNSNAPELEVLMWSFGEC